MTRQPAVSNAVDSVTVGAVEIQGDQRDKLRPLLAAKGWTVRG